jgi:tetratricopeptide (TPR) repeat protein
MHPIADSAKPAQTSPPLLGARLWSCLAVLLALTALAFLPALDYGFVYDDDVQVVSNAAIRSWSSVPSYFVSSVWSFHDPAAASNYYRPLFYLWLRLNFALFGLHAFGWHLSSLLAHLAASGLVFALLRRHFRSLWVVAAGALVFGVHPVHIESVVWVSGATDILATIGILGSLLLWLHDGAEPPGPLRWMASLVCYAAALLIKETSIVFPAIIFLYALAGIPREPGAAPASGGRLGRAIRQVAPFLGVTLLYLTARFFVLHGFRGGVPWVSARVAALTAPSVLLSYLRHLLWPAKLSLFYDLPLVESAASPAFWLPLGLLGAVAIGGWFWWRRQRDTAIPAAFAWIVLPLLPVLNIAFFQPDDFAHDRYLYLSLIGLSFAVGALPRVFSAQAPSAQLARAGLAAAALLSLSLALSTAIQSSPWRDNLALYTHAVERAPRNTMARNNLAGQYAARGRFEEAAAIFRAIVVERPDFWLANYNFGYVNYRLKRFDLAEMFLLRAVAINPLDADEYAYLGLTCFRQGRLKEAEAHLRSAIARKPGREGYHLALGAIHLQEGDLPAARAEFLEELKYHPESQPARAQLAALSPTP